jgi:hypothetical protein
MNHKHTLIGLALSLSTLLPTAALAHDYGASLPPPPPGAGTYNAGRYDGHSASGVPSHRGRYESRTVNRWVPGRSVSVWVPESCSWRGGGRHHHHRPKFCVAAHYEQRWVPAHYEQVQEMVWVPAYQPGVSFRLTAGL